MTLAPKMFKVLCQHKECFVSIAKVSQSIIFATLLISKIILFSFALGCCGAIKENACMLGTYFVIILILFISLVVAAVVGYNKKFDTVPKPLKETMKKYKQGSKTMKAWDKIQKDVSCIRGRT